jgi:small multidrug resistance pump
MSSISFLWLAAATAVFVAANGVLKTYAVKGGVPVLLGASGGDIWGQKMAVSA